MRAHLSDVTLLSVAVNVHSEFQAGLFTFFLLRALAARIIGCTRLYLRNFSPINKWFTLVLVDFKTLGLRTFVSFSYVAITLKALESMRRKMRTENE